MNRRPTGVIPRDQLLKLHMLLASFEAHSDPRIADYRWSYTIGECLDSSKLSIMDFIADHDAQWTTFQFLTELDLDRARVFAQMVDAKLSDLRSSERAYQGPVYLDL